MSETAPNPGTETVVAVPVVATVDPPKPADAGDDLAAQLAEWKAEARKHEENAKKANERAKENAKAAQELEKLRQQSMTEQEKAMATAETAGYEKARVEFASKLVDAELRAAAAGRLDAKALNVLLQGLNRAAFLLDDGTVDEKSVREFVDGIAPPPPEPGPATSGFPDLGQGARGPIPALNGDPLLAHIKAKLGIA